MLIIALLIVQITQSQTLETQIDSVLLAVFKASDEPGAVFLVAKDGKPMYRKAFGKSNIELDVNMKPENIFQIG
ncbi:beta-lactamase family protein [Lutibacter maritimus]|uniref:beta-lactamase family protein n=1 Tax=Lutibacter maritimus TaxID=593133 RepID=UPI001FE6762F|nr:beta-lactamase family protein [Lutibacter maritimus]